MYMQYYMYMIAHHRKAHKNAGAIFERSKDGLKGERQGCRE
jgi:hypothetical protein